MSFFEWFSKSLYDKKVIAYSRFRQITATIWHTLFVILLASIPFFISFNLTAINGVNQLQQTLQQDLPAFTIKNGVLHTEQSTPFTLEHQEIGIIMIDSSQTNNEDHLLTIKNGVVLTYDKVFHIENNHIQAVPYALLGISELNNEELLERVNNLKGFLPILLVIVTIFIYLGLLGLAFLGITVFSYLAMFIRGERKMLQYRHIWSMTAHAFTLPVIITYWFDALFFHLPFIVLLIATCLILYFAIQTIPLPKKRTNA